MCSPSPPPTPDYAGAATAQGAANLESARATAKLSNPNVRNPYGTQTVTYGTPSKFDQAAYDKAVAKYNADLAAQQRTQQPAAGIGDSGFGDFGQSSNQFTSFLSPPSQTQGGTLVAPNRADFMTPGIGDPDVGTVTQTFSPEQQKLYEQSVQTKGLLGELGIQGATALKGVVGRGLDLSGAPAGPGSYGDVRDRIVQAQMARVSEDAARTRDQANSELIAAGIRPGTKAYADRMNQIQRGINDAQNIAESNASSQIAQAYGMDAQSRQNYIAELLAQRQTPLNEINALMSGSQVSNPFAGGLGYQAGATVSPAPIFAGAQAQGQAAMDAYNAEQAGSNAMMSGLFSLGSAGIGKWSDRRLKKNIHRIGMHPLGVGIYSFRYVWGEPSIGVMADEVRKVMPCAVHRNGMFDCVDYKMLGF